MSWNFSWCQLDNLIYSEMSDSGITSFSNYLIAILLSEVRFIHNMRRQSRSPQAILDDYLRSGLMFFNPIYTDVLFSAYTGRGNRLL